MRTLYNFGIIPFDDPGISVNEIIGFTTDHLQRAEANNEDGRLDLRIANTTTALNNLLETIADDDLQLGHRKSVKLAKAQFREEMMDEVRRIAGRVTGEYGKPSPEFTDIFPKGLTIFTRTPDDRLYSHLETMVTGVSLREAALGATTVQMATDLRDSWATTYAASEIASGEKTHTEAEKRAAREDLQLELFLNLQTIIMLYPRQPEVIGLFMQQYLLGVPGSGPVGTGGGTVITGGGSTAGSTAGSTSTSMSSSTSSSSFVISSSSSSASPGSGSSSSGSSGSSAGGSSSSAAP